MIGLRIAIAGIHIESSTFAPYLTHAEDFTVTTGDALLDRYAWRTSPWAVGVEWIPTLHARALPGGVVAAETYAGLRDRILTGLREAGPVDGVLFDIHGAMSVGGLDDAEADLAEAIRGVVGLKPLMSASLDLHGNVSQRLFAQCDLLTAYRTAPHVDQPETRERAARLLVDCLRSGTRPLRALVHVPILLPGEQTNTQVEPGRSLYASVADIAGREGILDATVLMGFPWADQPRCTGVVVVSGTGAEAVEDSARDLAEEFWGYRNAFEFVGPTGGFVECLDAALASEERPFFISDTGDNPGAGGTADATYALHTLVSAPRVRGSGRSILVAALHDPSAAAAAHEAGVGARLSVLLGGRRDRITPPAAAEVAVRALADDPEGGRVALLSLTEEISVVVTEHRKQYSSASGYDLLDVPLSTADIVVVKIGYLEPDLSAVASGWMMALTPGAVNQDLRSLRYDHLPRPIVPLDSGFDPLPFGVRAVPREVR